LETVLAICGIIGGIAAIYGIAAYFKDHVEKPKEQKMALAALFKTNQILASEILDTLIFYTNKNNAHTQELFQGITFDAYISLLTKSLENDLADETLRKVTKEKLPESVIASMTSSLNTQFTNLSNVKNYLHLYLDNK
jgi:hypothetical protein